RSELEAPGVYRIVRDASGAPLLLSQAQSVAVNVAIAQGTVVGVALYPQVIREYPDGALAAQTLGFVRASDGEGQYGVEQIENTALAGRPGVIYTAVDAQGNPIATAPQRQTPAVPGATVTLTLDANVQYWAEQGLAQAIQQTGADGGTVLVMDPATGAILAMANQPTFDPNDYAAASLADLNNPAMSAVYDPGSTMKAITMAAGVQNGLIAPDTTFLDTGSTVVDGVTISNFDHHGHGVETMTQVLQYSANVGAIWVAQRVGATLYYRNLAAFGFGQPTGVSLPNEVAGLLTRPSAPGEAALTLAENSFGESIGVTPLQMVSAYAALANGGLLMRPYVVASVTAANGATTRYGPHVIRRAVSQATAQTVTQMLVDSSQVSEAEMWRVNGYRVAAKTGTSTPDPADPTFTYASVLGYAPASHPRFVLLVKLDHPHDSIFGGAAAGPVWRALAEQLFTYYRIPPDRAN
ncbi:MAG: penicillin-binding protein 2, partial [Ktedonobacterales bacterium]